MAYFVDGNTGAVTTDQVGDAPSHGTIEEALEQAGKVLQACYGVSLRRGNPEDWEGPTLFVATTHSGTVYLAHRHADGEHWALERRNSDGTYRLYPRVTIAHLAEGESATFVVGLNDHRLSMVLTSTVVSLGNDRDDPNLRVRQGCGKLGEDGQVILEG